MDQTGENENESWLFLSTKINVTVKAGKVDEKKSGHLSSFHVSFQSCDPYIVQEGAFFATLCSP